MNAAIFNNASYVDITGIYLQRARRQLIVPPPTRAELQPSPYPTYTEQQLNMRRKCEILKYERTSTNANSTLTKQQRFAQLVNGSTQRRNYTTEFLQGVVEGVVTTCPPLHDYVSTPGSSCDVPGSNVVLSLDPTIPLYLYNKENSTPPSALPVDPGPPFYTFITTDISMSLVYPTQLFVLYIGPTIPSLQSVFQFSVPFVVTSSQISPVGITNVYVYVYYNATLVASNDVNGTYSGGMAPLVARVPRVTTSLTGTRGVLYVDNMQIYSTPGFVLDVKTLFFTQPKLGVTVLCNQIGGWQITAI